jgi:hypothetical protein
VVWRANPLNDDPYMVNSTYSVSLGGNLPFSSAWFSNPKRLGNRLVVDGRVVAHGPRQFFDAESCTALESSGHAVALESLGGLRVAFQPLIVAFGSLLRLRLSNTSG